MNAGSVVHDLTPEHYNRSVTETSFGRLYETDSSNTSNVPWDVALKALLRTVSELDGIAASTAEINVLDGMVASSAELNVLDGMIASSAELNVLSGMTASSAELNTLDGAEGYSLGHVASSAQQIAESTMATTGGSVAWATGLTGIESVIVTPIRITAAPGTSWACVTATWTGATVTLDQWRPTSGTNTTLIRADTTERTYSCIAVGT